jgi:signal transduction histidine kinase
MPSSAQAPTGEWLRRLSPLIFLACALAFVADLTHIDTLAFGVFYIPMVCTAVLHRNRSSVWWLAGLAILMVVVGTFIPDIHPSLYDLIGNRMLSVVAILVTAGLVSHAWQVRESLAEQTRRAETAERLKTEIFTNLGYDLRAPLHAIIGLTQLMSADCRPNQREPLGVVRLASRRLLATISNLVDLTRFEEHIPRSEPVDLGAVLRRAVEEVRDQAKEGHVTIVTDIAEGLPSLTGDAWAARRIVENILDNAVKFTPPGGSVKVSVMPSEGAVTVTVTDTGEGMPEDVLSLVGRPFRQAVSSTPGQFEGMGAGLALSRRLADAIRAELCFESMPVVGTSATVRFPYDARPPATLIGWAEVATARGGQPTACRGCLIACEEVEPAIRRRCPLLSLHRESPELHPPILDDTRLHSGSRR